MAQQILAFYQLAQQQFSRNEQFVEA